MRHYCVILSTIFLLSACANATSSPKPIGMANPASVYCQKKGGKLVLENTEQGQIGLCHLPDGTQIEEWTLFRRDHPQS